jgi:hypothetical protein
MDRRFTSPFLSKRLTNSQPYSAPHPVMQPQRHKFSAMASRISSSLGSDSSCGLTSAGDQENVDAQLGPLQDNGSSTFTHLPRLGSPALGSGQCTVGITNDQRGIARP